MPAQAKLPGMCLGKFSSFVGDKGILQIWGKLREFFCVCHCVVNGDMQGVWTALGDTLRVGVKYRIIQSSYRSVNA